MTAPAHHKPTVRRIDCVLLAVIVVGVVLMILPVRPAPRRAPGPTGSAAPAGLTIHATEPAPPGPAPGAPTALMALPEPQSLRGPAGVEVSRIDAEALQRWCRARGLPDPPVLSDVEPAVARALLDALGAVESSPGADSLGRMGMISAGLGCFGSAVDYFRRAADAKPDAFRWRYYIGCVQQTLGEYDAALQTLQQARGLDPEYAMTYGRVAEIHLWAGRFDEAVGSFRMYNERAPQDSLGYVGLARVDLHRGHYAAALEHAEAALARVPRDFQGAYCLARALSGLERHAEARAVFDYRSGLPQEWRLEGRDPLHHALRASTGSTVILIEELDKLDDSRDWDRLAALAEEIAARRPGDVPMLANLASYYRKLRRFEDAHAVLDRAAEVDPRRMLIKETRAELLLAERRYDEARDAAGLVIADDPQSTRGLNVLGRARFMLGDYPGAVDAMQRCVASRPEAAANVLMLGEALLAAGRRPDAAAQFGRVLELVPDHPKARRRLAELRGAAGGG